MADIEELRKLIEEQLTTSLPQTVNTLWKDQAFGSIPKAVTDSLIMNLITPCHNLLSLGGKRWRPLLQVLCAGIVSTSCNRDADLQDAIKLTPLVEFVHTASLIHDDIEDKATERRGKPCAHITYGTDAALNAGAWLYFLAPAVIDTLNCSSEKKAQLYSMWTMELRRLHLGQAMDIYWHNNPDIFPPLEEYQAMVQHKTGTLCALAVTTGVICGGADSQKAQEAGLLARRLGEGFQILDDVQNLSTGNPGKKRGDDIVEGKKSLPVLMHIQKHPEDSKIIAQYFTAAGKNGFTDPAVENCIRLLEEAGSIKAAFDQGRSLVQKTCTLLTDLFGVTPQNNEYARMIHELFTKMLPAV